MGIDDLRHLQFEFEKTRKDVTAYLKPIIKLRDHFVQHYTSARIKSLAIDDFVTGKESKTSFCYRIETELNSWGNIQASYPKKFGVYYGHNGEGTPKEYRIGKKAFGSDIATAFDNVIAAIVDLIDTGHTADIKTLNSNPISPMFKGKILSLYYPERFLNIYSQSHLNHFLDKLSLVCTSPKELYKQQLLMDFKASDEVMRDWTTFEYNRFLYKSFNRPTGNLKSKDLSPALKGHIQADLPPMEKVKPRSIDLMTENLPEQKTKDTSKPTIKQDHLAKGKKNIRIGNRGEQIVMSYEIAHLTKIKRKDLADKVSRVSEKSDAYGYDILSYDDNGNEKYIEVKSTTRKIGYSVFHISANELEVSRNKQNYYFYFVYDAHTTSPQIWAQRPEDILDSDKVRREPTSFKLTFKTNNI